jgi:tetratricopeptide (TPR) repeat protein
MLLGSSVFFLIKNRSQTSFWIIWAFCFWLPTSNLLVKLDTLGANRFLYVPAIGFCVILTQMLLLSPRRFKQVALFFLMAWYAFFSNARSRAWATQLGVIQWMIKTNPLSYRGWEGLACYHMNRQNWDDAHAAFERALQLAPHSPENFYNLGILEYSQKNYEAANQYFLTASQISPLDPDTWEHLGAIAQIEGRKSKAIEEYLHVLDLRPYHATSHYNLGRLFLETGHLDLAVSHYRAYLSLTPEDADAESVRTLLKMIHHDHPDL